MKRKTNKMRGSKTHGYGSKKKHRGKGSRGGKGMAGTGKRADQKKTFILTKQGTSYYGKRGFFSVTRKEVSAINLDELQEKLSKLLAEGVAKPADKPATYEIDLAAAGYDKLLGRGNVKEKFLIKVKSVSAKAKEKVESAGGQILAA